ncbi:MAG: protein kinase [Acidobacteriota bacterium]|nr:protein kinase [Acidobacteriota bacterium]
MTVAAGTRLGPYEVIAPIGAGGMGEVWRGRDTRLDRSVAIKILPAELAQNAQFKLRFEREAKTISQLSHPNICTLYDVGENYLVMELLEGESLADKLTKGPLALEQVLRYGVQIADALDKAHRAGIVHRDLKPGNIMITKAGAKLLDFGLAKGGAPIDLDGATQHKPLTQEGTILGTFQYMAPEQLEGEEADARTDIFGLGAVLYEMATGHRAFEGKTKTSLIAAIVTGEPKPMSHLQPLTPPALEHVVRKCLAKDRDDRWQSAHDIAEEMRWISEAGSQAVAAPSRRRTKFGWPALSVLLLLSTVVLAALLLHRRPARRDRIESSIELPPGARFSGVDGPMALSPDGRYLAFVALNSKGQSSLWIRSLSSAKPREIAGTDDGSYPFWSPDSHSVAFFAQGKLKRIAVEEGTPETLADVFAPGGGTWGRDGTILFSSHSQSSILKVRATGGPVETVPTQRSMRQVNPWFLPDGKRFLYTSFRAYGDPEGIHLGYLDGGKPKLIVLGAYSNCAYDAGFLLYSRDGDLRAQPFDLRSEKTTGDPKRIVDRVQYNADGAVAVFGVSQNGILTYMPGGEAGMTELVWTDRHGRQVGTIGGPEMYYSPRLSHDKKRIAFDLSDRITAKGDVWVHDLVRGRSSKLTYQPANESGPIWSPDDRRIYYFSEQNGDPDIFEISSKGAGQAQADSSGAGRKRTLDVTPDGKFVAIELSDPKKSDADVYLLNVADHKLVPLLTSAANETDAAFSADGRWIAYTSDESGRNEVYVRTFPEMRGKWLVSNGGGGQAAWRADGREMYYVSGDKKLVAVPVTLSESFEAGTAEQLFDINLRGVRVRQYDVMPDGQRFIVNRIVAAEVSSSVRLIENWTEGLHP